MSLRAQFTSEMKKAMLAKDSRRLGAIRLIIATLKERDIAVRPEGLVDGIPDDQIMSMLKGMIKQRRDSIEMYEKGGRPELAQQEQEEITVIESFLPAQMSEAEMTAAVEAAITETGAATVKDLGKIMAVLKEKYPGTMDFGKAGALARGKLAA
jgi:uncharacterized protein YqeY